MSAFSYSTACASRDESGNEDFLQTWPLPGQSEYVKDNHKPLMIVEPYAVSKDGSKAKLSVALHGVDDRPTLDVRECMSVEASDVELDDGNFTVFLQFQALPDNGPIAEEAARRQHITPQAEKRMRDCHVYKSWFHYKDGRRHVPCWKLCKPRTKPRDVSLACGRSALSNA